MTKQLIKESELVDRRLYRIIARNFFLGVWDAQHRGFIGIREKFGDKYLFTEYNHETGGTARAWEALDVDVPPEIELREHSPLTCMDCGRLAEQFRGNAYAEQGPPFYRHVEDRTLLESDDARLPAYRPLFEFLTPYADAEEARWRAEHDV